MGKPAIGPNGLKNLFSLELVGGAKGNVANPAAWR